MEKEVLVINYHQITPEGSDVGSKINRIYCVNKSIFEEQIRTLIKNKIPILTIDDILNDNLHSPLSVAITVDDGNSSDYQIVYPFLKRNNIKATFFLLTNKHVNWNHINEMINQGFVIGSHGVSHRNLTKLNESEVMRELLDSKKTIEKNTHRPVNYLAFPFGLYNGKTVHLAKKAGYKAVLTTDIKTNKSSDNSFIIHRWSIKRTTSVKEFEKALLNRSHLNTKIRKSMINKFIKKVIGKRISDQLNILINKQ